jgi:exopolyphosphatase/pppGpp-phosphohydrolase
VVARVVPPRIWEAVEADRRLLRLGEGVDARKRLAPPAMDRVIQVLKEWHDKVGGHSVDAVVVGVIAVRRHNFNVIRSTSSNVSRPS